MGKIWALGKKILIWAAVIGAGLGLAGTRWDHKEVGCTASGRSLEGTQTTVRMMGVPVASHFNYTVRQGGKTVDSSAGFSIFFSVNANAQEAKRLKTSFCATGDMATPPADSFFSRMKKGLGI